MKIVKRLWNDPVWSKVLSAGIIAAITGILQPLGILPNKIAAYLPIIFLTIVIALCVYLVYYAKTQVSFYQEREEMPPLSEQLKEARELWFIFFTGSVVNADQKYNIIFKNRHVRLILPDPYYPAFADLCKLFVQDFTQMQRDVLALTGIATRDRAEVRWYQGPIGSSVIIGNPNSADPWAKVELLVPFGATGERPSFSCSAD